MALEIKHLTIKVQVSYQSDLKQARQLAQQRDAQQPASRIDRREIVQECLREIRQQPTERFLDR